MTDRTMGLPATIDIAKSQAKRLRTALKPKLDIPHGQALELIARVHGEPTWGRLGSVIEPGSQASQVPVLQDFTQAVTPAVRDRATIIAAARAETYEALFHSSMSIDQRGLNAIYAALTAAKKTHKTSASNAYLQKLRFKTLISITSIETYLDKLDLSLGQMMFDIGAEDFVKMMCIEVTTLFRNPPRRESDLDQDGNFGAATEEGLRPAGFAAALIWLERMGFETHPRAFYEPFLKEIQNAEYLSNDELTCLWHSSETSDKPYPTNLRFTDSDKGIVPAKDEIIAGRNGLEIEVTRSEGPAETIKSLRISR